MVYMHGCAELANSKDVCFLYCTEKWLIDQWSLLCAHSTDDSVRVCALVNCHSFHVYACRWRHLSLSLAMSAFICNTIECIWLLATCERLVFLNLKKVIFKKILQIYTRSQFSRAKFWFCIRMYHGVCSETKSSQIYRASIISLVLRRRRRVQCMQSECYEV